MATCGLNDAGNRTMNDVEYGEDRHGPLAVEWPRRWYSGRELAFINARECVGSQACGSYAAKD
jgi:hypothetical protein